MSPILKTFMEKMEGKVGVEKVDLEKINVDEHQDLAVKYNVMSIPTLVLLKDGEEVDRKSGVITVEGLEGWIDEQEL